MKEKDLVSVIIPIYNAEKYLESCLQSILSQSYKNIEVICVNDGSKDKSLLIIENFAKIDKRILIVNQANKGVTEARKNGVQNSCGKWIVFSDSDDFMPIDAIKNLVQNSDNFEIVIGQVLFEGSFKWPYKKKNRILNKNKTLKEIIRGKLHCGPVAKLFSRKLFDNNTFNISADICLGEDKLMNLNLITNISNDGKIYQIPNIVYKYIQRPTNHLSNKKIRQKRMELECAILRKTSFQLVILRKLLFIKEEIKIFIKRFVK